MKTPTTKSARNLIKLACEINNCDFYNSWSDKTSKLDPNRRSVSFMIQESKAFAVLTTLFEIYRDLGYNSPIKITQSESCFSTRSGGCTYIRAIATLDK
jgi:hypothetical protein